MERWRQLPLDYDQAGPQLARSEALFAGLSAGGPPTLHWYITTHPALILGLSQRIEQVNQEECARRQITIYRRRAGGNLVYLSPLFLSLDIALPANHPLQEQDIVRAYQWVGQLWTTTVQALGVTSARTLDLEETRHYQAAERARQDRLTGDRGVGEGESEDESLKERLANLFCFGSLSPFETVVPPLKEVDEEVDSGLKSRKEPRKLVGLCQVRRRAGTIWQCGIALRWESALLSHLPQITPAERRLLALELPHRAAGLHDLGHPEVTLEKVIATFEETLTRTHQVALAEGDWQPEELTAAEEALGRYREL